MASPGVLGCVSPSQHLWRVILPPEDGGVISGPLQKCKGAASRPVPSCSACTDQDTGGDTPSSSALEKP